jgi:hypothetical protein
MGGWVGSDSDINPPNQGHNVKGCVPPLSPED